VWLLLLLVLLLATGLRLVHLSHQSFWLDEVLTVNTVRRAVPSLAMSGTTPPLYYILMTFWVQRLVPETEAMVRLPSALFGIGAVALLFLLGRRLLGTRAGLFAALLLAVSPFHIHYSQEARAYSLMVLLTLLSWLALIRVLDRESPVRLASWAATTALLLLSHNYALFLVAAQLAFLLIWGRRHGIRPTRWLIGIGLLGLLSLPWIRVLLIMVEQLRHAVYWIQPPVLADFVKLYRMMCSDSGWLMKIDLLLVLAGLAWWRYRFGRAGTGPAGDGDRGTRLHGRTSIPLLGSWLFIPLVLMVAASWFLLPLYQHRYALALLPPFLLLVAWGASGHGNRPVALVLVGLVLCFNIPGLLAYYSGENREPWREAAGLVANLARPGDTMLFIAPMVREPFNYYYRGLKLPTRVLSRYPWEAQQVERFVTRSAGRSKRLWAVVSHCRTGILEEILQRRLGPERLLEQWEFLGITIYCYRTDRFDSSSGGASPMALEAAGGER
jgi:4-amino-4-deoxy-L-arabinose transferase-like glycosyltransferase